MSNQAVDHNFHILFSLLLDLVIEVVAGTTEVEGRWKIRIDADFVNTPRGGETRNSRILATTDVFLTFRRWQI